MHDIKNLLKKRIAPGVTNGHCSTRVASSKMGNEQPAVAAMKNCFHSVLELHQLTERESHYRTDLWNKKPHTLLQLWFHPLGPEHSIVCWWSLTVWKDLSHTSILSQMTLHTLHILHSHSVSSHCPWCSHGPHLHTITRLEGVAFLILVYKSILVCAL